MTVTDVSRLIGKLEIAHTLEQWKNKILSVLIYVEYKVLWIL